MLWSERCISPKSHIKVLLLRTMVLGWALGKKLGYENDHNEWGKRSYKKRPKKDRAMWGHHKNAPPTQKQAGPHHSSLTQDLIFRSKSSKSLLPASYPFMPLCCFTSWQVSILILKSWSSFWGVGLRNQRAQFSTIVTLLASGHWLRGACIQAWGCELQGHWSSPEAAVPSAEGRTLWSPKSDRSLSGTDHQEGWPWGSSSRHWQKGSVVHVPLKDIPTLIPENPKNHARHSNSLCSLLKHPNYQVIKVMHIQRGTKYLKDITLKKAICALLEVQWWTPWACLGQALELDTQLMAQKQCWIFAVHA